MVLAAAWESRAFISSNVLPVMLSETLLTPGKLDGSAENTLPHNAVNTNNCLKWVANLQNTQETGILNWVWWRP